MNQEDFDKIYFSKKSTDQLLERVFKPEKYKEFHGKFTIDGKEYNG